MKKLFKVVFMSGNRTAYTTARSFSEAYLKVRKVLGTDSGYTKGEATICSIEILDGETWPGVFGG